MVPLTPPYDVRPGKTKEVKDIRELIMDNFGEKALIFEEDDIVLLNHVGSEDQMDEIVFFGKSIGNRRYDLATNKWIIKLNNNGLYLLNKKITKNWVKVDSGAKEKILQGANILIPGVIEAYSKIEKGDYVAVLDEEDNVIAGGIARIDEVERKNQQKGVYAKNYLSVERNFIPGIQKYSWDEIVHWNAKELQIIEDKAIRFIQKIRDELKLPILVSFSGGKDSLVTLSLVQQALEDEDYKVLFVNTGIEFPETVDFVKNSSEKMNFKDKLILENVSTDIFWEAFDKFGPPGRDFRHCCKFAKLAPIQRAIEREYNNGQCISFVGQRRYESFRRAIADTWQNQYVKNQINVTPIQDWTAFSIWLYILWKDLPYNPLYDESYERIGCWACPSSDMAQLNLLKKSHQDLYFQLYNAVEKWRNKRSLPSSYWKYGLWRFKNIPRKITTALSLKIDEFKDDSKDTQLSSLQLEASNCITLPISVIGAFSESFGIDSITQTLPLLGRVQKNEKLQFVRISNNKYSILIYSDGTFKINFKKYEGLTEKFVRKVTSNFVYTILRSLGCTRCSLCEGACEYKAISVQNNTIFVRDDSCTQCNQCFDVCPIVTVVNRDLPYKINRVIKIEKSINF